MEEAKEARHRGVFVIMGDRAKDQVVNLVSLWKNVRDENQTKPKLLWCFEKELGFSSH
jgi:N-acetyltransferase 10